jgi:hypothetical protein
MVLDAMYPGKPFSPLAILTDNVGGADTVIPVNDTTVFPAAPNYATIGTDTAAETILYNAIVVNSLSGCVRGIEGSAQIWPQGTIIARNFTNADYMALIGNINAKANTGDIPAPSVTTPTMNGAATPGTALTFSRGDHAHPTDTTRAAVASVPVASSTMPAMDGAGVIGIGTTFARGDHAHPTDTSRVPTTRTINSKPLSGDIVLTASDVSALSASTVVPSAAITNPVMDGTATPGTAATFARGDHAHPTDTSRAAIGDIPLAGTATPVMDGAATPGIGTAFARNDHAHPSDTSRLPITGGAMTGALTLSADPTVNLGAATKQYVDSYANSGVRKTQTITAATTITLNLADANLLNGNIFRVTPTSNMTVAITNTAVTTNTMKEFELHVTVGTTAYTITWFSGITWISGSAPTITASKTHVFTFRTTTGSAYQANLAYTY